MIATTTAAVMRFEARLKWRSRKDIPRRPVPGSQLSFPGRVLLNEREDERSYAREITGEIRALDEEALAAAAGSVLSRLTEAATLTEALLEAGTVRTASPVIPSAHLLEEVAMELRAAGVKVWFRRSWETAGEGDLALGGYGIGERMKAFLYSHPAWKVLG